MSESLDHLFVEMYQKFNDRDADGVLWYMSESVHWPKAFEGGFVVGKDAVKEYWTRQWGEIEPSVTPVESEEQADGKIKVTVHQVVHDKAGVLLADLNVFHVYSFENGLISQMDIVEG